MAFQVLELLLDDGLSPYAQWFDGLAPDIAAKVATAKYRMQQGNLSSVEWFRGIGEYTKLITVQAGGFIWQRTVLTSSCSWAAVPKTDSNETLIKQLNCGKNTSVQKQIY